MHSWALTFAAVQGALAPVGASAALLGGYVVVKYFPQLSLQVFFNAYFWLLGSVAVAGAFQAPMKKLVIPGTPALPGHVSCWQGKQHTGKPC